VDVKQRRERLTAAIVAAATNAVIYIALCQFKGCSSGVREHRPPAAAPRMR
jgi:hypothetical protein